MTLSDAPAGSSVPFATGGSTRLLRLDDTLRPVYDAAVARARERLGLQSFRQFEEGFARLRLEGAGLGAQIAYLELVPDAIVVGGDESADAIVRTAIAVQHRGGSSRTDQFLATATFAAAKVGGGEDFLAYLRLVRDLAGFAPIALDLFFDALPRLFERLAIGGLSNWVRLGLQSHSRDTEAQRRYFSLQSQESRLALETSGGGTLLTEVQRSLDLYLLALWGHRTTLKGHGRANAEGERRTRIERGAILMPEVLAREPGADERERYRASAMHAAAHLAFTKRRFMVGNYKPIKLAVVSLIEDARVEELTMRTLPGMRRIWAALHRADPADGGTFEALVGRLSRALIDPEYRDDHPWVRRGVALFRAADDLANQDIVIAIASPLANDIGQMRLQFNFKTYVVSPSYRDDNASLWDWTGVDTPPQTLEEDDEIEIEESRANPEQSEETRDVELREAEIEEPDPDTPDDESRHAIALDVVLRSASYGEWDYAIGMERPAWATVHERAPVLGDESMVDAILRNNVGLLERVKRLIRSRAIERVTRLRKQHEGDRIDFEQALSAAIDLRAGLVPDPRIHVRTVHAGRNLSVLVLMDLSKSTGDAVGGTDQTVLDLARESVVLLADAMSTLGDRFAIHGFTSNGRRDVTYYRLKDFDEDFGSRSKAALAGLQPQLSTRIGAAVRHAGELLRPVPSEHKVLLLITDGEPSDIDVQDRDYLTVDARKAVERLRRLGILSFCLSVDPRSDRYISKIFGARNFAVMDRVSRLPEKLPLLYLRLTNV